MSLRYEQYRAVKITRDLLRKLIDPKESKGIKDELRKEAHSCLRHYPFTSEETGELHLSQDPFGPDLPPRQTERCMHELRKAVWHAIEHITKADNEGRDIFGTDEGFDITVLTSAMEKSNELLGETEKYADND